MTGSGDERQDRGSRDRIGQIADSLDRKLRNWGFGLLAAIVILAGGFVYTDQRDTADRDRVQREGCQAGNVSRSQTLILLVALARAAQLSPGIPTVTPAAPVDSDTSAQAALENNARAAQPAIRCDLFPAARKPLSPAEQVRFVEFVAQGFRPMIDDQGRIVP